VAGPGNNAAYTGTATSSGTYTGLYSKRYVVEITTSGAVGVAQYKVSEDGGVTWTLDDAFTTSTNPTAIYDITNSREAHPDQVGAQIAFTNSGTLTAGDRFTIEVSQYNGDSGDMNIIIGPAAQLKTNVAGNTAFGQAGDTTNNLFDILAGLKDSLQRNVTSGVQAALEWLGNAQDNNTSNMADIGARLNRIEVNRNMLSDLEAYNTNRLSGIEDLDIAKASLELNSKQMIFQAALYSAAKVTGLSLLNYLK
jgi:flagellin-like hook-associated protein FlgL